jgi:hypothetical protein
MLTPAPYMLLLSSSHSSNSAPGQSGGVRATFEAGHVRTAPQAHTEKLPMMQADEGNSALVSANRARHQNTQRRSSYHYY